MASFLASSASWPMDCSAWPSGVSVLMLTLWRWARAPAANNSASRRILIGLPPPNGRDGIIPPPVVGSAGRYYAPGVAGGQYQSAQIAIEGLSGIWSSTSGLKPGFEFIWL